MTDAATSAAEGTPDTRPVASTARVGWFTRACWLGFGLLLPIVCFAHDAAGLHVYGSSTSAARAFTAIELIFFAVWEWRGVQSGFAASMFAAAFAIGCGFAALTGVFLLPIALPASVFLIGLLGLVPFGTSLVYCVLASRAFTRMRGIRRGEKLAGLLFGAVIVVAPFQSIRLYERSVAKRALEGFVPNHYESYVRARTVLSTLPECDTSRLSDQPGPSPREIQEWCDGTWLEQLRDFAEIF